MRARRAATALTQIRDLVADVDSMSDVSQPGRDANPVPVEQWGGMSTSTLDHEECETRSDQVPRVEVTAAQQFRARLFEVFEVVAVPGHAEHVDVSKRHFEFNVRFAQPFAHVSKGQRVASRRPTLRRGLPSVPPASAGADARWRNRACFRAVRPAPAIARAMQPGTGADACAYSLAAG